MKWRDLATVVDEGARLETFGGIAGGGLICRSVLGASNVRASNCGEGARDVAFYNSSKINNTL